MSLKLQVTTEGTGENLVFLHGWGVNSGVWQPLVALLKPHFRITCIDLPGYGLNQQNLPDSYDLSNVAALIAEHIPPNSILVGWSLGGLIAQKIAIDQAANLNKLILVCSTPKFVKSQDWPGIEAKVLDFFMQQLNTDFKKTLDRFLAIQAMGSPDAKHDIKQIKQAVKAHSEPAEKALVAGLKMLNDIDLTSQLSQISLPIHALIGRLDTLVPVSLAAHLPLLSSSIDVQILANAAHAPFVTDPKDFAARIQSIAAKP